MLPNPYMHFNDRKKEGEQFRLQSAVVEKPLGIDKMLAFQRASAFVFFLNDHVRSFRRFRLARTIANADLYYFI